MKRLIILLLVVIIQFTIQAQKIDSVKVPSIERSQLLSKSKIQKAVGWVILGTGLPVVLITGYFLTAFDQSDIDETIVKKVFIASTVYTLVSIPLIRAGRLNKKRALAISLNNNEIALPHNTSIVVNMQPAISFQIPLN